MVVVIYSTSSEITATSSEITATSSEITATSSEITARLFSTSLAHANQTDEKKP